MQPLAPDNAVLQLSGVRILLGAELHFPESAREIREDLGHPLCRRAADVLELF